MTHQGSRAKARFFAVQALYQWLLTASSIQELKGQFSDKPDFEKADRIYFERLLEGVLREEPAIKAQLGPCLDRPFAQVGAIEKSILLLAGYELLCEPEVPHKVVINEAIEVSKRFAAEQSFRYINGVLDKMRSALKE